MLNTIILSASLICGVLSILVLWINYQKEKTKDRNAKKKIAKRSVFVGAIIIALNVINPLCNYFFTEEKFATKEDFTQLAPSSMILKAVCPSPRRKRSKLKLINNLTMNLKKIKKELLKNIRKELVPIITKIL